jgi:hypothetical protein
MGRLHAQASWCSQRGHVTLTELSYRCGSVAAWRRVVVVGASAASVRGITPSTTSLATKTGRSAAAISTVAAGVCDGLGRSECKAAGDEDACRAVSHENNADDDGGGSGDFKDDAPTRRPLRRIHTSPPTEAESAEEEETRDSTATDGAGGAAVVHVHVIKLPAPPELPPWATRVRSLAAPRRQRRGAVRVHV